MQSIVSETLSPRPNKSYLVLYLCGVQLETKTHALYSRGLGCQLQKGVNTCLVIAICLDELSSSSSFPNGKSVTDSGEESPTSNVDSQ